MDDALIIKSSHGKTKKKSSLSKLSSKNRVSDLSPITSFHSANNLCASDLTIEHRISSKLPNSTSIPTNLNESGLQCGLKNLKMFESEEETDESEPNVFNSSQSSLKRAREKADSSEDSETGPPHRKSATGNSVPFPENFQDTISSESPSEDLQEAYASVLNRDCMDQTKFQTGLNDTDDTISTSSNLTRRVQRLEQRASSAMFTTEQNLDCISERSTQSANSLTGIPASDVRNRTFLVGSAAGAGGSMLGAAELDKLLPERRTRIFVVTWNMSEPKSNKYPNTLETLLFPEGTEFVPNIYAICVQEGPIDKRELILRIQATIGPSHVLYEHVSHGTLALCIFIHRDLIWYISRGLYRQSVPEKASISTRMAIRTKGAVGISFLLFGSSFLFICSHFKSDDGNFVQRVEDFERIVATLDLPKLVINRDTSKQSKDVTQRFDVVFWSGDLNFRIERPREIVERVMSAIKEQGDLSSYEDLLLADELLKARAEGHLFSGFEEGRINFPPTYKYDLFSSEYDTSDKNRVPSYTDRILYKSLRKGTVVCTSYKSIQCLNHSDHRPVFALFETEIKPGRDNIPLSAGNFYHDIYTEGNRRRALHLDLAALKDNKLRSKMCFIS